MTLADLDSFEKSIIVVGLLVAFVSAVSPSKSERPDDSHFMKGALAFARTVGVLLAVLTIIAIRRLIW